MRLLSPYKVMVCLSVVVLVCAGTTACAGAGAGPTTPTNSATTDVITDTSFLADIVQNVVGDRLTVSSLIPLGADPHSFEPTPKDARRVAQARAIVVNVTGLLPAIDQLIAGVRAHDQPVIEAAAGISDLEGDPHCWLDPVLVVTYAENIATRFSQMDHEGVTLYRAAATAYEVKLLELDSWIKAQVDTVPVERRLLVTNHESLGRFAARYGFRIIGTVFPSPSGEGSPSARQLAQLVADIKALGAVAIFVETGSNTDLAEQVGAEAGVKVVTDLYTHSLGEGAPTYIDMMRWNATKIVEALR